MNPEPLDERSWMTPPDPTQDAHSAWDAPDPLRPPGIPLAPDPRPGPAYAPAPPPPAYLAAGQGPWAAPSPPAWRPPPPNHLVWAILVTVFCFLPFGVVAIVKASQVNLLWAQGSWSQSRAASASARLWAIAAMIMVPVMFIGFIVFVVLLGVTSARTGQRIQ